MLKFDSAFSANPSSTYSASQYSLSNYYSNGTGSSYGGSNYGITNTNIYDLAGYLSDGEVKQAIQKYELVNSAGNQRTRNTIENRFASQYGTTFTEAAVEAADSSLMTGVKEGIPIIGLFLTDGVSDDEVKEELTGVKQKNGSKFAEWAGAAASGAAAGLCVGGLHPIGAVIGCAWGIAQKMIKG